MDFSVSPRFSRYELDAVGAALYDTPRGVEIQWDYSLNGHFVPET